MPIKLNEMLLLLLVLFQSSASIGCDFCQKDQGAVVYSFKNSRAAKILKRVYAEVKIIGLHSSEQKELLIRTLKSIRGILANTINISRDISVGSFVYDSKIQFETIAESVKEKLGEIQLTLLKTGS